MKFFGTSAILQLCFRSTAIAYLPRFRVDSFRYGFLSSTRIFSTQSIEAPEIPDEPRLRASFAFSMLARRDKSWQRFQHMVDMAVEYQAKNEVVKSIVDVGTDHGLLAVGLAATGCFENVLGVDVSSKALESGGFELLQKTQAIFADDEVAFEGGLSTNRRTTVLPLDFRLSDGLKDVQSGEADSVCIAGMGVHVMKKILHASTDDGILDVDRLNCHHLIVQPTNSRPRNLMHLYQALQESRWQLDDERIEYLSDRWYISSSFIRAPTSWKGGNQTIWEFPTSKLVQRANSDPMKKTTLDYFSHHLEWIQKDEDSSRGTNTPAEDLLWREWVRGILGENNDGN